MLSNTSILLLIVLGLCPVASNETNAESAVAAARGVLQRLLPRHVDRFVLEVIPPEDGRDVFEIESQADKIVLRGSTGVALCSALNWYLKHHCFCHISWAGSQLNLPESLPVVPARIRQVCPYRYRYWLNYCVFSYSLVFWNWDRWEWLIDWMALQGINMPLAVTGQEATWQVVCRQFGLSEKEIGDFLPGPAYLPFGWMGCLDGWGGPLPQSWIDRHRELQSRILARQRELGMTPILQGFTGHVPASLQKRYPQAKFRQLPSWAGFTGTTFVDPQDPLFLQFGQAFVEEQTRQFGTDHYYAADTFVEMLPPSNDPAFLADIGRSVFKAMTAADPQAYWIMQGWIFHYNPQFWQAPQARALFGAVPDDRLILLEMCRDIWQRTEAYYGKPWIWAIIQNFGNNVALQGDLAGMIEHIGTASGSPDHGKFCGLGAIMEGLDGNPVVFDLLTDLIWRTEMPDVRAWLKDYTRRRYGRELEPMNEAWNLLLATVYSWNNADDSSLVCWRPFVSNQRKPPVKTPTYDRRQLAEATRLFLACAEQLGTQDTYRFDLVNLIRQVLADQAIVYYRDIVKAYRAGDRQRLSTVGDKLLALIRDMDRLLDSRREFLLGPWLADARRWATTDQERRLYEWNARNQITLWAMRESLLDKRPHPRLHDYARKQWSGLLVNFYLPRWERFLKLLDESLAGGKAFDEDAFNNEMEQWEWNWTNQTEEYPVSPSGDSIAITQQLWDKYAVEVAIPLGD